MTSAEKLRVGRVVDMMIAEAVATGMMSVLNELATLVVLTEYHVVRFTTEQQCYCGNRACDRNFASSEMWDELSTLRMTYEAMLKRLAARMGETE